MARRCLSGWCRALISNDIIVSEWPQSCLAWDQSLDTKKTHCLLSITVLFSLWCCKVGHYDHFQMTKTGPLVSCGLFKISQPVPQGWGQPQVSWFMVLRLSCDSAPSPCKTITLMISLCFIMIKGLIIFPNNFCKQHTWNTWEVCSSQLAFLVKPNVYQKKKIYLPFIPKFPRISWPTLLLW